MIDFFHSPGLDTMRIASRRLAAALAAWCAIASAHAQTLPPNGYLCCNLRADASGWISDSNYQESGKRIIPVGTPVSPVGFGRQRVELNADGTRLWLGNDYSRALDLESFAKRYVVQRDPKTLIAGYPANIQRAIQSARVTKGMTKEQVLMAVGYPIVDENPTLEAPFWRYWLFSFSPFTIHWDGSGRVADIETDPQTRLLVVQP